MAALALSGGSLQLGDPSAAAMTDRQLSPCALLVLVLSSRLELCTSAASLAFDTVFSSGMVLQRGDSTKIWGSGAIPNGTVRVTVAGVSTPAVGEASSEGDWRVTLPLLVAANSSSVHATDGHTTAMLSDVAIGELLLCGGQSNLGHLLRSLVDACHLSLSLSLSLSRF